MSTVITTEEETAVNSQTAQNEVIQNPQHSPPSASTSTSSAIVQSFDSVFDEFLNKFLDTDPSQLDDHKIRAFTLKIPKTYFVLEDRFPTIFKVLFKIKEVENKAVYNDTLALIEKCFYLLDYNKFLVQFWNCDEFKVRDLGPLGYSFTDGRHRCDFSDVQPHDDVTTKNVKAIEVAWSMLLDVEATVDFLINTFINDRAMSIYFAIILRRFKCLGDYKIKLDNKEVPLFIYSFRKAHHRAITTGHLLQTTFSCLVTVTWTPKSSLFGWSLMKPNDALLEIMKNVILDDERLPKYMVALQRLFKPIDNFWCNIEWNSNSNDFDNPSIFLFHLIKFFHDKNSIEFNDEVFCIFDSFKKSLNYRGIRIQNFEMFEEEIFHLNWPFAYCILDYLEVQHFKHHISESIFKSLPPAIASEKYISIEDPEPTLEKALTEIMEVFFLCRTSRAIPDTFYKNLLSTYEYPKSVIDTIAKCIVQAYKNLKNSIIIKIDVKFVDFLSRICEFCFDVKVFEQFSCMVEMNTDLIHQSIHLIIIGRVIRIFLEEKFSSEMKKPTFSDMNFFVHDLFKAFVTKVHSKFGELRIAYKQFWPAWRKGDAPSMTDETTMAINHILNAIQKEAYCIYDTTYGMNEYMLEFLFNLYKERRHFGFTFSKLDSILRKNYPRYFEELEERRQQSSAVVDRRPPSSQHGRNDTEFRSSRQDNYQPRNDRPQRFEQQQSHSQTCNDSQQRNYRNENFNSQNARDNNYRGSFENRAPTQQNSQRNGTTNNGGRDFYNSNGSYRSNNNGNN